MKKEDAENYVEFTIICEKITEMCVYVHTVCVHIDYSRYLREVANGKIAKWPSGYGRSWEGDYF